MPCNACVKSGTKTIFITKYDENGTHILTTGFVGEGSGNKTDTNTQKPFHGGNCDSVITPDGRLVVNYGNEITKPLRTVGKTSQFSFCGKPDLEGVYYKDGAVYTTDGEKLLDRCDILLRGDHNVENYMAAIAMVYDIVGKEPVVKVAKEFGGVEHRIEFVREIDGVRYGIYRTFLNNKNGMIELYLEEKVGVTDNGEEEED